MIGERWRWEPASLGRFDVVGVGVALVLGAWVRGWDYGSGGPRSRTVGDLGATMSADLWSALMVTGAVLLALGIALRIHWLVWLAHGWLAVVYSALIAGLAVDAWFAGSLVRALEWGGTLGLPVYLHWTLWLRTGIRPPSRDEAAHAIPRTGP